ncbi:hypothetical protein ACFMBG_23460 [Leisingera sp. D0M16]
MPSGSNPTGDPTAVFAEIVSFTNSKLTTMVIKDLVSAGILPKTVFTKYAEEFRAMAAAISETPPECLKVALHNLAAQLETEAEG